MDMNAPDDYPAATARIRRSRSLGGVARAAIIDDSEGAWLLIAKKGAPRATVTQPEALEVALCFGWIDGQVGRHDEHFYKQRFTHRTPEEQVVADQLREGARPDRAAV